MWHTIQHEKISRNDCAQFASTDRFYSPNLCVRTAKSACCFSKSGYCFLLWFELLYWWFYCILQRNTLDTFFLKELVSISNKLVEAWPEVSSVMPRTLKGQKVSDGFPWFTFVHVSAHVPHLLFTFHWRRRLKIHQHLQISSIWHPHSRYIDLIVLSNVSSPFLLHIQLVINSCNNSELRSEWSNFSYFRSLL